MTADSTAPVVRARGVTKIYGTTMVLAGADLDIAPGTIHGLVGANGAGKSTFSGIVTGKVTPSSGTLEMFGSPAPLGSPHAMQELGVAAIYQELTILPELSTQANLFLGRPARRGGFLREGEMRRELAAQCARVGVDLPADKRAGDLSVADQQMLEIMRALARHPRLILFDEPTAALTIRERRSLLRVMRQLRSEGVTQLIVSHDLEEVMEICDEITVFRGGQLVDSRPRPLWTKAELATEIRGGEATMMTANAGLAATAEPMLAVEGLTVPHAVSDITLSVRRGEILGLAGLVGSGRTSILRAIGGASARTTGTMTIAGKSVRLPRSPRKALRYGIAMIPDDRKLAGIVAPLSAAENITLTDIGKAARAGFVSSKSMARAAAVQSDQFGVPAHRLPVAAGNLSGGTQQKLLFARWLHRPVQVLLADEPTRGIDIGAKHELFAALRHLANNGLTVILTSTEIEDLASICDRVLVLDKGQLVTELDTPAEFSEERLRAIVIGDET